MNELIGYIATGLISLIVGLILQRLRARPKLLYWVPGSFIFNLNEPNISIGTDSLTIQNDGRESATEVEVLLQQRPDHFQFSTPVNYAEEETPNGQFVIRIASLGGKEFVNLQILSHTQLPVLLSVRSAEGKAQQIQVHLQRLIPKFIIVFVSGLVFLGGGFALYWLLSAIYFISKAMGFLP